MPELIDTLYRAQTKLTELSQKLVNLTEACPGRNDEGLSAEGFITALTDPEIRFLEQEILSCLRMIAPTKQQISNRFRWNRAQGRFDEVEQKPILDLSSNLAILLANLRMVHGMYTMELVNQFNNCSFSIEFDIAQKLRARDRVDEDSNREHGKCGDPDQGDNTIVADNTEVTPAEGDLLGLQLEVPNAAAGVHNKKIDGRVLRKDSGFSTSSNPDVAAASPTPASMHSTPFKYTYKGSRGAAKRDSSAVVRATSGAATEPTDLGATKLKPTDEDLLLDFATLKQVNVPAEANQDSPIVGKDQGPEHTDSSTSNSGCSLI